MLLDPLPISVIANQDIVSGDDGADLAVIDVSPEGVTRKAVYSSYGADIKFTCKHSISKENGAVPTSRTLVRIDVSKFDTTLKQVVTTSVYIVAALPQGGFSNAQNLAIVYGFLRSLKDLSTSGDLDRVLAGEG